MTRPQRAWIAATAVGVVWIWAASWLTAFDPLLGLGFGVLPVAAFLLIKFSWVRLVTIVGGGMFVLGSSSDLSAGKIVYAVLISFCALISGWRLIDRPPPFALFFRPLVWWGVAFAFVLFLSYLSSPGGSDFGTFGRQSLFYVLVILGPVVGLDAGRDMKPAVVYSLIGLTGTIAAVGFALDWLDRRGVTALPVGRVVLSSLVLPGFAFGLAIVLFFFSIRLWQRALWLAPLFAIPISMLVTGTRTNLIIFLAAPAVMGRIKNSRIPPIRLIVLIVAAGAVGVVLFPLIATIVIAEPGFIQTRVQAVLLVLSGSAEADQSFAGRTEQYALAAEMISRSPFLGYGLGYPIPFTIDSPLLSVVRLGWLGVATIAGFLAALSMAVWRSARGAGRSPAHTAWWAFVVVILANIPFGTPLEDRGFGFTIMLATMALASALTATGSASSRSIRPPQDVIAERT
ncbi:O-antigen ligase family protein [Microbacterium testaceum]|uniref:O-antigen ligase family protein n=1 Tax=Microbacterium testaceum TaxID=2033 RepID=UPI003420D48E